jgi:magnesium-transporting ATPase (P-type)
MDVITIPNSCTQVRKSQDIHNGNYCFTMDGSTFELLRIHDLALLDRCIHRSKVFARMAPEHKQHLIEALQKIGYANFRYTS